MLRFLLGKKIYICMYIPVVTFFLRNFIIIIFFYSCRSNNTSVNNVMWGSSTCLPGVSKPSRSRGVVRFHPAVLSPGFGCLARLFFVLMLTLNVLCVRLDPVALCIAAGVHSCLNRCYILIVSNMYSFLQSDVHIQLD